MNYSQKEIPKGKAEIRVIVSEQTIDQFRALTDLRNRGKRSPEDFSRVAGEKIDSLMSRSEVIVR